MQEKAPGKGSGSFAEKGDEAGQEARLAALEEKVDALWALAYPDEGPVEDDSLEEPEVPAP